MAGISFAANGSRAIVQNLAILSYHCPEQLCKLLPKARHATSISLSLGGRGLRSKTTGMCGKVVAFHQLGVSLSSPTKGLRPSPRPLLFDSLPPP